MTKQKILITGITGSGASYLAEYLVNNVDCEVHGISRWHSTASANNLAHIKDKILLHECDLCDLSSVTRILQKVQPNVIYHLASHANVRVCFDNPIAVFQNNVNGTINLFEAIRLVNSAVRPIVHLSATSESYGNPTTFPMTEEHPTNPVNIYAVSKLTQEKIALSYMKSFGIQTIITRSFAYINPRREDIFSSIFAKQVVEIEAGKRAVLKHGNLDSVRTLIDVRDIAKAYHLATLKCVPGEIYNVGGSDVLSVGDFLEKLKQRAGCPIRTELDPLLLRPVDVTKQICDVTKFNTLTGFTPTYSLDESIDFLLGYYRNKFGVVSQKVEFGKWYRCKLNDKLITGQADTWFPNGIVEMFSRDGNFLCPPAKIICEAK